MYVCLGQYSNDIDEKESGLSQRKYPSNVSGYGFFQLSPLNHLLTVVYTEMDQRQTLMRSTRISEVALSSPNQMGNSPIYLFVILDCLLVFLFYFVSGDCRLVFLSVFIFSTRIDVHCCIIESHLPPTKVKKRLSFIEIIQWPQDHNRAAAT